MQNNDKKLMHMAAMGLAEDAEAMDFIYAKNLDDIPQDNQELIILDDGTFIGEGYPLVLIAGPCVIESYDHAYKMASCIQSICFDMGVPLVFKASFDKANRSSIESYRGPGLDKGLEILNSIREDFGCHILTDIHEPWQAEIVSEVVDIIQIPAFLCRQTDLLVAAAKTGKPVNVKKAQFVAPKDMFFVAEKLTNSGANGIILTERGTCFGYNNLVVDMRSLMIMRQFGFPICFDATHSTQMPGGGRQSGGNSDYAPALARSAAAVGIDVLFMEVHDNPKEALSDSTNQLPLSKLQSTLEEVVYIHDYMRR